MVLSIHVYVGGCCCYSTRGVDSVLCFLLCLLCCALLYFDSSHHSVFALSIHQRSTVLVVMTHFHLTPSLSLALSPSDCGIYRRGVSILRCQQNGDGDKQTSTRRHPSLRLVFFSLQLRSIIRLHRTVERSWCGSVVMAGREHNTHAQTTIALIKKISTYTGVAPNHCVRSRVRRVLSHSQGT